MPLRGCNATGRCCAKKPQDWAIAFDADKVKHIYFVAETKGDLSTLQFRGIEDAKIECARKHFAAISSDTVIYDHVACYEDLLRLVK